MKQSVFYIGLGLSMASSLFAQKKDQKPNILFIAVDDLRPELSCYGADYMHTPNIDRLASKGTLFQQAYCQQAVSSASRNSLLTGYRPDAIGIYDLATFFRTNVPDVITLPQHFKNNGYKTETVGKIYHISHGNQDDSISWSVPKWNPNKELGYLEKISNGDTTNLEGNPRIDKKLLPYFASNISTEDMTDSRVTTVALQRMKEIKKEEPFFLAVGFVKPHLPFVAPKKYWELYDEKDIVIPERKEPEDMPSISMPSFGELRSYYGIPNKGFLNDKDTKGLIHGYRACVSFVDEQVGRLLDALEENGLADNTIIVLWGDHGWKLGEYGNWCKHSNMEYDTQVPLIIAAPGYQKNQTTKSLVEFVDIYPTLCDLAGLEKPNHLQGQSMLPIMKNPNYKTKNVAISQYPRGDNMGYSMRVGDYRYTRWVNFHSPNRQVVARELYDHSNGKLADKNLANDPNYKKRVDQLDELLTYELKKYTVHPSIEYTAEVENTDNVYVKNDFAHGFKIGEPIEKGDYNENNSLKQNQWNLSNVVNNQAGSSPLAVPPLYYNEYIESGKSNAFKLNKLSSGARLSTYSMNNTQAALKDFSTGSVYLSFMINVEDVRASEGVGIISLDGSYLGNFRKTTLYLKKLNSKNTFTFGIAHADQSPSSSNPIFINESYKFGVTYLVVIKHNFDADHFFLFVNPVLKKEEPLPSIILTTPENITPLSNKGLRAITVRQRVSYAASIGGLRLTKDWKQIVDGD